MAGGGNRLGQIRDIFGQIWKYSGKPENEDFFEITLILVTVII